MACQKTSLLKQKYVVLSNSLLKFRLGDLTSQFPTTRLTSYNQSIILISTVCCLSCSYMVSANDTLIREHSLTLEGEVSLYG